MAGKVTPSPQENLETETDTNSAESNNLSEPKSRYGRFENCGVETLYQSYSRRVRRELLICLPLTTAFFNLNGVIASAISYNQTLILCFVVQCILGVISLSVVTILYFYRSQLLNGKHRQVLLSGALWIWFGVSIEAYIALSSDTVAPNQCLGWHLMYIFATLVTLPASLWVCVTLTTCVIIIYTTVTVVLTLASSSRELYSSTLANTICASLLMQLLAFVIGVARYLFMDRGLRKSFLDTKASLSISLELTQRSREQEQLLLSVLPRHVAEEMLRDIGSEEIGQFRKIYMKRHENVSILFADIVGFTALSSTVTPKQLVRILNDLFATFDKLANKYGQLRIKILGDCYYSISGCPDPRPDHAVLTVHMGLSMVEAIREVREKTRSGVNMRVGIHTGAVLAGVLGQVRWQFDVLGKEVTLANHLESGGIPGRVHISEKTAGCLNGEFDLEPGAGETRDDLIKMAAMKTFLIKSVIKPYPHGTLHDGVRDSSLKLDEKLKFGGPSRPQSGVDQNAELYTALMEREENTALETEYDKSCLRYSAISLLFMSSVSITQLLLFLILTEWSLVVIITSLASFAIVTTMAITLSAKYFPQRFAGFFVRLAKKMDATWLRRLWWASLAFGITGFSYTCGMIALKLGVDSDVLGRDPDHSLIRSFPTFLSHIHILLALSIASVVHISFIVKTVMLIILTGVSILQPLVVISGVFKEYDSARLNYSAGRFIPSATSDSVMAALTCVSLAIISKLFDHLSRKLFFYIHEVDEMRQQITSLRSKNESLIYNILPSHVAFHFIGAKLKDDELYSQFYEDVGIMFASCPNFNDFYTEDSVNNNGLECLRFLNEILSDYDDLLKEQRFKSVVKIKSIGSTLMLASGMDTQTDKSSRDQQWQHLEALVDFGFAMKVILAKINAESFNNFQLRIGVNHGPILAGVIGAGKPHYDIWGNSVNVASRMESTGQVGRIQVVEDTMTILSTFGYKFSKRGMISVKGKGNLMTYFLDEKQTTNNPLPNQVAPL